MKKTDLLLMVSKISWFLSNKSLGLSRIPGLIKVKNLLDNMAYKIANTEGLVLIKVQGHDMYVNIKDSGLTPSLINKGIYEEYETEIFKSLITSDTTLIDIGANIGYYTLIATNLIKKGKIYSFEPVDSNYELLIKNIALNNSKNVKTFQKAVSNKKGKMKIYVDEKNLGNHSLSKKNVPNEMGFKEIETITLDSFLNDSNNTISNTIVIKIDTQGAEGLIIEGAQDLLLKDNIKILMEFWPNGLRNMGTDPLELLNKLQEYGFDMRLIDGKSKTLKKTNKNDIIEFCDNPEKIEDQLNLLFKKGK